MRRTSDIHGGRYRYRNSSYDPRYTAHARWEMWRRMYMVDLQIRVTDESDPLVNIRTFNIPRDALILISIGLRRRIPMAIMNYLYDQIPCPEIREKMKARPYVDSLFRRYPIAHGINFAIAPDFRFNNIYTTGE